MGGDVRLESRFAGALLGVMLGDVIGAVVESESPAYIRKTFRSIDDLLALEHVPDILGRRWKVGRFTDDTQMTICVAEWLIAGESDGKSLLARFAEAYRPARRYGSGAARLLEAFPEHHEPWQALATLAFPNGSYGNGSAMRVAPIGCRFFDDPVGLVKAARISSLTTHSHPLAITGATLQAAAVAAAVRDSQSLLSELHAVLDRLPHDTTVYRRALEGGPAGTGVAAHEAVPTAIWCFLQHPDSFEKVIHEAVFLGGDTDTIASMAGAISGAYLGVEALPRRWLAAVREEEYPPARVQSLAHELVHTAGC